MTHLVDLITARKAAQRNASLDAHCRDLTATQLLAECAELDAFRRRADNLYERVRALFFLYAIHRFHLPAKLVGDDVRSLSNSSGKSQSLLTSAPTGDGLIPFPGYEQLLHRRFEEAIDTFLAAQAKDGPSDGLCSALANAYHRLAFQTLADQVRRSVRSVRGNQWMFRVGHPADQPLRLRPELLQRAPDGTYPILREQTPVRMDLTHSAWSDIFFLGMDFPEGAKVLNVSVDLGIHGRDAAPRPPVSAWLRVLDEPVLRLTSVDLGATADITALSDVFDFAKDYLGLLKAAVIAAGVVPPGIEGSGQSLAELLARIVGPGRGLELVSCVNDIPKGSRLAVSTNLLGSLVSVLMRATGQASGAAVPAALCSATVPVAEPTSAPAAPAATGTVARPEAVGTTAPLPLQLPGLTGPLAESERRIVLARALLGEWLGGSGGGWQDSGGVWPGMKLIEGVIAGEGDPEFGISRGRLMPQHRILNLDDASAETRRKLQDSLVLVHGGMAQNVGPILEMVTEKYLLRCEAEWRGRQDALRILDEVLAALMSGDIRALGAATTRNFREPIQAIIPWASTAFTEQLIERVGREFGDDFWGFWMLGGMSGGGMGFIFAPHPKAEGQRRLQEIMSATKRELQHALPFAMEPVVFDYAINERGTWADLLAADAALMPAGYYALTVPKLLRTDRQELPAARRAELDKFAVACRTKPDLRGMVQTLFDTMFPRLKEEKAGAQSLDVLLAANGFDREAHEAIRADLKAGRIGLAQNRLPANSVIEDVRPKDVTDMRNSSGAGVPPARSLATVPVAELNPAAAAPAAIETVARPEAGETPAPLAAAGAAAPLYFTPFDPKRPASISQRRLPHWTQAGCTYFVTFRLADSLPAPVLTRWRREKEAYLAALPQPISKAKLEAANTLFTAKLEAHLDAGHGACWLKEPAIAELVESAMRHFDGQRYQLGSFVIMPNHVHALVRPLMEHKLAEILAGWKSFTAHEVNKRWQRLGSLWQDESFDHVVRDAQHLAKFGRYIEQNPAKAKLRKTDFRYGMGSGGVINPASETGAASTTSRAAVPAASVLQTSRLQDAHAPGEQHQPGRLVDTGAGGTPAPLARGLAALRNGEAAVVTLSAGAASRWTQGAGVVKSLHPFCKLGGRHRTFLEVHLAKSRQIARLVGKPVPHVFTTSYLTHGPLTEFLAVNQNYGYEGPLLLSRGASVGLRLVPTARDLRFAWEEMAQQVLDEQQQKVRDSLRTALLRWAESTGEATDYRDNLPLQCLHPVGHFYEVPNLLRNGTLAALLRERPQLKTLLLHNIDTTGANLDPALLDQHLASGATLSFEVITRRLEDRGGGLARVDGRTRLVEGLAMPHEELEFGLSYYNTMTTWIDVDGFLRALHLTREDVLSANDDKIAAAIRTLAAKVPTYITTKDVKKRWGHGQEDVFPVAQFEKLWGDLTALPEIDSRFLVVSRARGQQLKDQAQLDGWLRDGSARYVESLCAWA